MGVALWLCPRANTQLYDKLTTVASSISTLFPGQPLKFEPHITITSNIVLNLEDSEKTRDDVNRILSSCVAALNSLPKNHNALIRLGKVNSERKFFKKLFFEVKRDPNLVSFAQIIRELFVILPYELDLELKKSNPHLLKKHKKDRKDELPIKQVEAGPIRRRATDEAAEWAIQYDPHLSLVYSDLYPIDNALWRTIKTRIQDNLDIDCDEDETGLSWDGGILKLVLCEGEVKNWITLGSVEVH